MEGREGRREGRWRALLVDQLQIGRPMQKGWTLGVTTTARAATIMSTKFGCTHLQDDAAKETTVSCTSHTDLPSLTEFP